MKKLVLILTMSALAGIANAQTVQNPGFETPAGNSTGAANWEGSGSGGAIATPYYLQASDAFSGVNCLVIEGQGNGVGAGPVVRQDLVTPVSPGTLTLSFQAKAAIQNGGANPQYQISWRNAADVQIGTSGFASFPAALNTVSYTSQTIAGLIAPANSDHCTINILLAVGAGGGDHWKVQIDDVSLTQNTVTPPSSTPNFPTNNAAIPTNSPASVLSMYNSSATYTDVTIDTWFTPWSGNPAGNGDYTITNTGAIVKKYLGMGYAGVDFQSAPINTAGYNTLHVDVWTPNANQFGIQLVSLDPSTQAGQVNFTPASGTITSNNWISLNIPLSQFSSANPNLDLTNLKQLLWIDNQGGGGVVNGDFYIDNVYFYSNAVVAPPLANYPTNAAPTPTNSPANVVALYNSASNYTTVPIDTWLTGWSSASRVDYVITNAGNRVVHRYGALNYAGVEFFNPKIDASGMTHFHVDLWTPNADKFSVKLVSFAPGAAEYEVVFTNNVITTNNWVSLDIPISTFTTANPAMDFSQLGQLLFINNNPGGPQFGTFFIDNVYFYSNAVVVPPVVIANYPTNAAPTPTRSAATVVSLYNSASNYTTVPIDTWLTGWSGASYSDYSITNAGNRVVKRYSALNFAGVEFFNPKINASGMTHFHVDLWTPNADKFSVKLVSFNPGGQEYEVVFTNNVITTNNWVSLDIPISTFTTANPLMDFANLGQLLFINNNPGGPQFGTFFIDNVYFYANATPPTVQSPAVSGGNFTATTASQVGFDYVLQGTPSLAPATWSNLQTNAGTGGTLNFSVPVTPGDPQRFFRIVVQ